MCFPCFRRKKRNDRNDPCQVQNQNPYPYPQPQPSPYNNYSYQPVQLQPINPAAYNYNSYGGPIPDDYNSSIGPMPPYRYDNQVPPMGPYRQY